MALGISQSKVAALLGVSRGRITQLKNEGRLVLLADGRVNLPATLALLRDTQDPDRVSTMRFDRAEAWLKAQGGDQSDDLDDASAASNPTASAYREFRVRKERALAQIAELEYRLSNGELLLVSDVRRLAADLGVRFRGELERLPDNVSPELMHRDRIQIADRIRVEMDSVITNARAEYRRQLIQMTKGEINQ